MSQRDTTGDALLHRYHDGELDAGERARLESDLDGEGRDKLAALGELGGALRAVYQGQAESFDAWPSIEKAIAAEKVIPIARKPRRRGMMWLSSLTAVAAAAAMLLVFAPGRGAHPSNGCDVDEIEVTGAVDTILTLDDDDHGGSTTVLWIEE